MAPNILNMVVGDTHSMQALDATSHPVTGLNWTSSDPAVVSVSTTEPIVLTALAAGHVTVTAGGASADITVWPAGTVLPPGTVIWSNPGGGQVTSIIPAVPSSTGVADVFAIGGSHASGDNYTVQAITSEGLTAWATPLSSPVLSFGTWRPIIVPDFQGGLIAVNLDPASGAYSVVRLNGMTGAQQPLYTPPSNSGLDWWTGGDRLQSGVSLAIHPDGTIFAVQRDGYDGISVIGIDSSGGGQKFSIPLQKDSYFGFFTQNVHPMIIAGDGYAYLPYDYQELTIGMSAPKNHLRLLRIATDGTYNDIDVFDWDSPWAGDGEFGPVPYLWAITNADSGVLLSWENLTDKPGGEHDAHMAVVTDTSVTLMNGPRLPGQVRAVEPVLQAQDGSFVGRYAVGPEWCSEGAGVPCTTTGSSMITFDATGAVRWTVPGYDPKIATADGGVIATDEGGAAVTFDQNGNATGQMANFPVQSWTGNMYQVGSVDQLMISLIDTALSFSSFVRGNPSLNGTAAKYVAAPTFIPALLVDYSKPPTLANLVSPVEQEKAQLFQYYATLSEAISPTRVALYPLLL